MTDAQAKITRDDLENRFRALKGEIDSRADDARSVAVPAGIAAAVVLLLLAYLFGKRVGTTRSTVVEIRRI